VTTPIAAPDDRTAFRTTDEIRDLVAAFEDTTLPYGRWTHAAHLAVGTWYTLWYGRAQAMPRMRVALQRYNAAHAHEPMKVGYHETMTGFWLWAIDRALRQMPVERSLAELVNGVVEAHADRQLPLRYYTRDRLMSPAARRTWTEPDVRPLEP